MIAFGSVLKFNKETFTKIEKPWFCIWKNHQEKSDCLGKEFSA